MKNKNPQTQTDDQQNPKNEELQILLQINELIHRASIQGVEAEGFLVCKNYLKSKIEVLKNGV